MLLGTQYNIDKHLDADGFSTDSPVFFCPELRTVKNPAGKLSTFFKDIMIYNDSDES